MVIHCSYVILSCIFLAAVFLVGRGFKFLFIIRPFVEFGSWGRGGFYCRRMLEFIACTVPYVESDITTGM